MSNIKNNPKRSIPNHQFTYNDRNNMITPDPLLATTKTEKTWNAIFQALKMSNCEPRMLYPAKLSFKIDGKLKYFKKIQFDAAHDDQVCTVGSS